MRVRRGVLVLGLLLVAGCAAHPAGTAGDAPDDPSPTTPRASVRTTGPSHPAGPTLRQIAADPRATLNIVTVRPGPAGLTVRAWWLLRTGHRTRGAIVTSDDGMRSAGYRRARYGAWDRGLPKSVKPHPVPGMGDLMPWDVFSLQDGTRAQQGGSDGATLDPFQRVARSVGGGPWQIFDVPETRGQQAYTSGQVVLPDGRLLVLLDHWSGDRRGRPSSLWHGLWISDGADWASFEPWHPSFTPALPTTDGPWGPLESIDAGVDPRQTRAGIVWVTTLDRLYVSEDGGRTFREVPARPSDRSRP